MIVGLALIALLASRGGHQRTSNPRAASVAACARSPAPNLYSRLPRGIVAAPVDDVVAGFVADQLNLPAEIERRLDMRLLESHGRRLALVVVMPVGRERQDVLGEFATRARQTTGAKPRSVRLGRKSGTLFRLEVAGRRGSGLVTFVGCRAVLVGARSDGTVLALGGALAGR